MSNYRHYDVIEAHVSSRKRTILRRALDELEDYIVEGSDDYMNRYGINKIQTVKTHLRDIDSLRSDLNIG